MREIEFRGKRKDTGEWVYGDLWHRIGDDFKNEAIVSVEKVPCTHVVIPETVGQYTGLKDKNGVKIFEGDILRDTLDDSIAIVIFAYGRFMTVRSLEKEDICIGVTRWEYCEVIGNIHDNRELLEEAQ